MRITHDRIVVEIHLDPWQIDMNKQYRGKVSVFVILVHEIGHTLGLGHTRERGAKELTTTRVVTSTRTTTTTITALTTPTTQEGGRYPDFCKVKDVNTYLLLHKNLYVFYEKWMWVINIHEESVEYYKSPEPYFITDWLRYLPVNFTKVTAIYDEDIYMIETPSLRLTEK